jgi:hypothetical protein
MTDSIDDVMPDPSDAPYVSVLECTECGATGRLYSTAEPRPEQYRDCPECDTEAAEHDILMMSNTGTEVTR